MQNKGKLFLVQWDEESAAERACELRDDGWFVDIETTDGARAYRVIRVEQPDVVVIDLASKPSHGREVARSLREVPALHDLPLVFVDGDSVAIEKVKARIPGAVFATSAALKATLAKLARSGNGG